MKTIGFMQGWGVWTAAVVRTTKTTVSRQLRMALSHHSTVSLSTISHFFVGFHAKKRLRFHFLPRCA
eukprot:1262051-Rhodomonas_salina.4